MGRREEELCKMVRGGQGGASRRRGALATRPGPKGPPVSSSCRAARCNIFVNTAYFCASQARLLFT